LRRGDGGWEGGGGGVRREEGRGWALTKSYTATSRCIFSYGSLGWGPGEDINCARATE